MSRPPRSTHLAWMLTSFSLGALCCRSVPITNASPPASAPGTGGARVVVVDLQRVALESEEGRSAQGEMKKIFDQRQKDLDQREAELRRSKAELEELAKKGAPRDELDRRLAEWYRQAVDIQLVYRTHDDELRRKQAELIAPITARLTPLSERAAAERGADIVIDKNAVSFVRPDLDITETVMRLAAEDGAGGKAR